MPTTKATKEIAQTLGVSVGTLRNWSDQYGDYLSEMARPGHLPERRFTDKDSTILTYVKQLRSEGMQAEQIRQRLGETTFNDMEIMPQQTATDATDTTFTAIQNAPYAPESSPASLVALDAITTLQRRFEALESSVTESKRNQRDGVVMFGVGFVAACGLFILLLLLFMLRNYL